MLAEHWKSLPTHDDKYAISDAGRVKAHGKLCKLSTRKSGHLVVGINGRPTYVHRLVMLAFEGPCPDKFEVLHKNHEPSDNRWVNLIYGTRSENIRMDFAAGSRSHKGENAPNARLTTTAVADIRSSKLSLIELATKYKVHIRTIQDVIAHKTWATAPRTTPVRLTGTCQTKEHSMAKTPKTITIAEKKVQMANLKQLMKSNTEATKGINAAMKDAAKALADAKKSADASIKEAEKAAASNRKAAEAAVAAAEKAYAAAFAKGAKSLDAAAKGAAKLNASLDALDAMTIVKAAKPAAAPAAE